MCHSHLDKINGEGHAALLPSGDTLHAHNLVTDECIGAVLQILRKFEQQLLV